MAQLPPDGRLLIQQNDGIVTIFDSYTQEEYLKVNASDANAISIAQKTIYDDERLNPEQKCFAHFWCGYFYAYACNLQPNPKGF